MKNIVAVDIGGTKISAACYNGELCGKQQIRTERFRSADEVTQAVADLVRRVAQVAQGKISAVGVACPGPLQASKGMVLNAPTLGWKNYPLAQMLAKHLRCPVILQNDANAAAYGEYRFGAGCSDMAYVTISTGVGCGLILNGQVVEGAHEGAGEIGHMHMQDDGEPCVCGRRGCLEAYASGTGVAAIASRKLNRPGLDARSVAQMARDGNEQCLAIYRQAGRYLGKAFAAIQMLTDVERIVVGGSVSEQLDLMLPEIQRSTQMYSYWGNDISHWLKKASLGADAGLVGIGALVERQMKEGMMDDGI